MNKFFRGERFFGMEIAIFKARERFGVKKGDRSA